MSTTIPHAAGRLVELPEQFAELVPYSDWVLETWRQRYEMRLASSMDEMQAFYDAMMPRLQEIIDYCDTFDLEDLPDPVRNVLLLTFALCEVSFPVESWRQPRVPDSGAADLEMVEEPPL